MKNVILIVLIIISINSYSQIKINITLKDSTKLESTVSGISESALYLKSGTFQYSQMHKVVIANNSDTESIIKKLIAANVIVQTDGGQLLSPVKQIYASVFSPSESIIINGLDKFRVQRNTGKALQLIGAGLAASTLIIQTNKKSVSVALPIAGAALSMVGFIVDMDASRHLNFKLKK